MSNSINKTTKATTLKAFMKEGAIFILSSGLRINGLDNVGKLLVGLNIIYLSSLFTKSEKRTISFSTSVLIGVPLKPKGPGKAEHLLLSLLFFLQEV